MRGDEKPLEDFKDVSKDELVRKLKGFNSRRGDAKDEWTEIEFLDFLMKIPVSICRNEMTETLKREIAEKYLYGVEQPLTDKRHATHRYEGDEKYFEPFYTFDDLSILFDRSKASISQAVKEYGHLRPEVKEKCEQRYQEALERRKNIDILEKKLGRSASLAEVEAYELELKEGVKAVEDAELAEFRAWKKARQTNERAAIHSDGGIRDTK